MPGLGRRWQSYGVSEIPWVPGSLFAQPFWLDAVAPGQWDDVRIETDTGIVARLPYMHERKWGATLLRMPAMTQNLGPALSISSEKYATQLSKEMELMGALIEGLPPYHYFNQRFHHAITNWLPFRWRGFSQTTHYTYIVSAPRACESAWEDLDKKTRADIRKAEKRITVRDDIPVERLMELCHASFAARGQAMPYDRAKVLRIAAACADRGLQRILCSEDETGRLLAGALFVWDRESSYYLIGCRDPEVPSTGAMSLLIWQGIRDALMEARDFDFEGSMLPGVERFCRSFGAVQTPFFRVTRTPGRLLRVARALRS